MWPPNLGSILHLPRSTGDGILSQKRDTAAHDADLRVGHDVEPLSQCHMPFATIRAANLQTGAMPPSGTTFGRMVPSSA